MNRVQKIASSLALIGCVTASALSPEVSITAESRTPIIQQVIVLTLTAKLCGKKPESIFGGSYSSSSAYCYVSPWDLGLPWGGKILGNAEGKSNAYVNVSEDGYLEISSNLSESGFMDDIARGNVRIRLIYQGPELK